MSLDPSLATRAAEELRWLIANPEFEERPATVSEFLGPDYLNIEGKVRERIRSELVEIMGEEVDAHKPTKFTYAMITGAIGIGKTTVASIVLPYLAHWVLCIKNPQEYFSLLPGSRIAFMQMSTSKPQALEVVFGDIKARINNSPWFKSKYPYDTTFKNQLRFEKDIWIIPGDSGETTFEGYNIFGGILDEADSHTVTQTKDYAEQGFSTIESRMASRFGDRGFLLVIGQMKRNDGFAAKKYREFMDRDDCYAVRMSIWESMGWEYYAEPSGKVKFFYYDAQRRLIIPNRVAELVGSDGRSLIKIPELYRRSFTTNPEKALRDLAGIPMSAGDPFLSMPDKIYAARDRWVKRYGEESPVNAEGVIASWFVAKEGLKRAVHVDVAFSPNGDALALAMGHVREIINVDGEMKPHIVIDMIYREKAMPGREIFLGKIRQIIYALRDTRRFKINMVTTDGFQSTDFRQQMERHRFGVDVVSVDKDMLPYSDLRDALYEDRIEIPPYLVDISVEGVRERIEIAMKELTDLKDTGKKVDHPDGGSKDVADAIAGVVFTLMGDRRYHRKVRSLDQARERRENAGGMNHPAYLGDLGFSAPVPPVFPRKG